MQLYLFLRSYQEKTSIQNQQNPFFSKELFNDLGNKVETVSLAFQNIIEAMPLITDVQKATLKKSFIDNHQRLNQYEITNSRIDYEQMDYLFNEHANLISNMGTVEFEGLVSAVHEYFVTPEIRVLFNSIMMFFQGDELTVVCHQKTDRHAYVRSMEYRVYSKPVIHINLEQIESKRVQQGYATSMVESIVRMFDDREEINFVESDALNPISYHIMSKVGFSPRCVVRETKEEGRYVCDYSREGLKDMGLIAKNYNENIKSKYDGSPLGDDRKRTIKDMYVVGDAPVLGVKMRVMRRDQTFGGAKHMEKYRMPRTRPY